MEQNILVTNHVHATNPEEIISMEFKSNISSGATSSHYPSRHLLLPQPTSFNDILIPDELKVTNGVDRFVLYDNEDPDHRMITLSSDDDLDCLSTSENWHGGGTFKSRFTMIISF
ncbi:unnamed protein product [Rotaria magnacalcarata]|uniref:Uncharacterized protein n=1 Tax=Rotaria magnacalcarata TaxID=392030 RepID=A0A816BFA8_9BILA|nr:unnamed protein product [Rotaria magnacalcarata]CAF1608453.1 unnamed protein product [Rotaria magnacalcarata]CAF2075358.1 unnamed protein product [Rotaria magnacalcarata]CAF3877124.1 unnamed protein product [Rotaria magnacalcarata]CAF4418642.1 unnamed protein product [Rotaria magnacalcarata]